MIKKRDLLKQIHNLKKTIKPDSAWQKSNREILLSQIKSQTSLEFVPSHRIMAKNLFIAVYKPLGSFILIAGILLGAWIASVGATRNSLPGDFFYGVKLAAERVQVNLATNDEKKANLEMTFADRRLAEMKKVADQNVSQNQNENLKVSLKQFQESINNVKSSLAKLEKTDSKTAAKVADLVDEKTKEYVNLLQDQQDKAPELASNTEEAISASKATGDKALSYILSEFESGKSDLNLDQVKSKISDRIDTLKKGLDLAKSDIDKIITNKKIADDFAVAKALADKKAAEEKAASDAKAAEEAAAKASADASAAAKALADKAEEAKSETTTDNKSENIANNNANTNVNADTNSQPDAQNVNSSANIKQDAQSNSQPAEILPTIDEIKDKPAEINKFLAKADDFLKSNSVSQAFDQVKQADDILTLINKVIDANSQYLEATKANDASSSSDNSNNSSADNTVGKQDTKS